MQYLIGDVAKITGLSIEGIRKYEQLGIISSERDESNQYRQYKFLDVTSLIRSRVFRSLGFSLKEIACLTNESSLREISLKLDEKQNGIAAEMLLLEKKKELITDIQKDLDALENRLNQIMICETPAFYRIEFSKNGAILESKEIMACIHQWMDYAPFIYLSSRYDGNDAYGGLAIREKYADLFSIKSSGPVRYHPSAPGVQCYLCESDTSYADSRFLNDLMQFCEDHRFTVTGCPYSHSVIGTHKQSSYKRYKKITCEISA